MIEFKRQRLNEHTLCLMDIAPCPRCRRDSAHDGMLRLMEMFGCVPPRRGIATANMAARLALAKRNPNGSLGEALLAAVGSLLRGKVFGL
jgi:hypothetical protein